MGSGWIKIFEQKAWVFFVLAVFFGSAWYLMDQGQLTDLKATYSWSKDAGLLGTLFFGALTITSAVRSIYNLVRRSFATRKYRRAAVARLNNLSVEEHNILSYLLWNRQRSFNCPLADAPVALLVQKGLVVRGSGQQNILAVAHFVPDHIWETLESHLDDFNSVDPNGPAPWSKNWMTY